MDERLYSVTLIASDGERIKVYGFATQEVVIKYLFAYADKFTVEIRETTDVVC